MSSLPSPKNQTPRSHLPAPTEADSDLGRSQYSPLPPHDVPTRLFARGDGFWFCPPSVEYLSQRGINYLYRAQVERNFPVGLRWPPDKPMPARAPDFYSPNLKGNWSFHAARPSAYEPRSEGCLLVDSSGQKIPEMGWFQGCGSILCLHTAPVRSLMVPVSLCNRTISFSAPAPLTLPESPLSCVSGRYSINGLKGRSVGFSSEDLVSVFGFPLSVEPQEVMSDSSSLSQILRFPFYPFDWPVLNPSTKGTEPPAPLTPVPQTPEGAPHFLSGFHSEILRARYPESCTTPSGFLHLDRYHGLEEGLEWVRLNPKFYLCQFSNGCQPSYQNGVLLPPVAAQACATNGRHTFGLGCIRSGPRSAASLPQWGAFPSQTWYVNYALRSNGHDTGTGLSITAPAEKASRYTCAVTGRQPRMPSLLSPWNREGPGSFSARLLLLASGLRKRPSRYLPPHPVRDERDRGRYLKAALWMESFDQYKSFYWNNLSEGTRNAYKSVLSDILGPLPNEYLLHPGVWHSWIANLDSRPIANASKASYLQSAPNAAYAVGADLASFFPEVQRLLTRMARKYRKMANSDRRSKKNTHADSRLPFSVPEFRLALDPLVQKDWSVHYRDAVSVTSATLALAFGLRMSDVRRILYRDVRIAPSGISVTVPNWKSSSVVVKQRWSSDPVSLSPSLRRRSVFFHSSENPYSVYVLLSRFLSLHPSTTRTFLFSAYPWSDKMMSPLTLSKRWAKILSSLNSESDHIFRVANVSLARSARVPDELIMTRCDWNEEGLLDRYQRVVPHFKLWSDVHDYNQVLGLG